MLHLKTLIGTLLIKKLNEEFILFVMLVLLGRKDYFYSVCLSLFHLQLFAIKMSTSSVKGFKEANNDDNCCAKNNPK